MENRFFDIEESNLASRACLRTKEKRAGVREPLFDHSHREQIRSLELAALEHRRLLFQLGDKHGIKLHYGACLSMTEIMVALYLYWLNVTPGNEKSDTRERFILSKGHAAPSLYVMLFQAGFVRDADFHCYRAMDSLFQGHPDRNKTPGVDCTTGSLGQGLGVAAGIAWGYRHRNVSSQVYCLISDGECNEGSIWESALIASNAGLDNLVVFVDRNKKSSFGKMEGRNDVEPLAGKWRSFGWDVYDIDGHDFGEITGALSAAQTAKSGRPSVIIAQTVKGKGIPYAERHFVRSSSFLEKDQLEEALLALDENEKVLRA